MIEYAAWDFMKHSLAYWKMVLYYGPKLLKKNSYNDYSFVFPIESRETVLGTT